MSYCIIEIYRTTVSLHVIMQSGITGVSAYEDFFILTQSRVGWGEEDNVVQKPVNVSDKKIIRLIIANLLLVCYHKNYSLKFHIVNFNYDNN